MNYKKLLFVILIIVVGICVYQMTDQFSSFDKGLLWFVLIGFVGALIDGTLGMAYGVTCTTFLLSSGVTPRVATAIVHISEIFVNGFSGLAHLHYRNVDKKLFMRLVVPGVVGALIGAFAISLIFEGSLIKIFVAAYLLILGIFIIHKSLTAKRKKIKVIRHAERLALFGGCMDAIGGGGWGPIVASNIIHQGNDPRVTIGTVNAVEFFVTLAGSIVFFSFVGIEHWDMILAMIVGGFVAAPLGAYLATRIPREKFMFLIGVVIVVTSAFTLVHIF